MGVGKAWIMCNTVNYITFLFNFFFFLPSSAISMCLCFVVAVVGTINFISIFFFSLETADCGRTFKINKIYLLQKKKLLKIFHIKVFILTSFVNENSH